MLFKIDGFTRRTDFEDAEASARAISTIRSLDNLKAERRLISPAETVNGITIGARNFDWVTDSYKRAAASNIDPYEGLSITNPSSALGPGFAKSVKPEILYPGARELLTVVRAGENLVVQPVQRAIRAAGLKVAVPPAHGNEAQEGFSNGTSAAAALASRTAHRIHDALEFEYGSEFLRLTSGQRAVLLKALMVHPASWPTSAATLIKDIVGPADGRQHAKQKDNIRRFLGYGAYNMEDAIACASDRATFWTVGEIRSEQNVPVAVPIPVAFGGQAKEHYLSATLAWMTPVNSGRQSYRAVRLKLLEPVWLGDLAVSGSSTQPDQNQMSRGTVASRTWIGERAAVVGDSETVDFEVVRMPDTGFEGADITSFALAVTIAMPGVNEIYQQVRDRVRPQPRQRT